MGAGARAHPWDGDEPFKIQFNSTLNTGSCNAYRRSVKSKNIAKSKDGAPGIRTLDLWSRS